MKRKSIVVLLVLMLMLASAGQLFASAKNDAVTGKKVKGADNNEEVLEVSASDEDVSEVSASDKEEPAVIEIVLNNDILNVNSRGKWIKVYIHSVGDYSLEDIKEETIWLYYVYNNNDKIIHIIPLADAEKPKIKDFVVDDDGDELKVNFNRADVIDEIEELMDSGIIEAGATITLEVKGLILEDNKDNPIPFSGTTDPITIMPLHE